MMDSIYLMVLLALVVINVVLIIVMYMADRRRKRKIAEMVETWHSKNEYMEYTIGFCDRAESLVREARNSLRRENEEEYVKKCEDIIGMIHGANTALEILIADKKRMCDEKAIEFRDEIGFLPEEDMIDEIDAVSLAGNVLDNAIENAEKAGEGAFVQCRSTQRSNVWLIEVTNSKDPQQKSDGTYATTKEDKANHGMGLDIMRKTVNRYNGQMKLKDKGDTFTTEIYVILRKKKEGNNKRDKR